MIKKTKNSFTILNFTNKQIYRIIMMEKICTLKIDFQNKKINIKIKI